MNYQAILALLVTKFPGVRKDGLTLLARSLALQAATDEEVKAVVDKLTDAQVSEFVKDFRAGIDKEVSDSNKTYEANLRKKFDFVDKKPEQAQSTAPPEQTSPSSTNKDMAEAIRKAVEEAMAPLQAEIAGYKAGQESKARLQRLTEKLDSCKDKAFKEQSLKDFSRMSFKDEEEFAGYLSEKEKDIEAANQTYSDNGLRASGGSSLVTQKEGDGLSKGVTAFLKSDDGKNAFDGKKI